MIVVAVCDDDRQERTQEVRIAEEIFKQYDISAEIVEFEDGQRFLKEMYTKQYDIVLLDIQMPEVSGFVLAEEIYKTTGGDNIIFVSGMENLVFQSLHFRPFRFVRKSELSVELSEALESWIKQNTKGNCLEIKENGRIKTALPLYEILYIEVKSHYLYIHTTEEVLEVRGKLSDYIHLAESDDFIYPHYSYLCNLKYVYQVERDNIVMANGETIRISRGRYDMCQARYLWYIRKLRR